MEERRFWTEKSSWSWYARDLCRPPRVPSTLLSVPGNRREQDAWRERENRCFARHVHSFVGDPRAQTCAHVTGSKVQCALLQRCHLPLWPGDVSVVAVPSGLEGSVRALPSTPHGELEQNLGSVVEALNPAIFTRRHTDRLSRRFAVFPAFSSVRVGVMLKRRNKATELGCTRGTHGSGCPAGRGVVGGRRVSESS